MTGIIFHFETAMKTRMQEAYQPGLFEEQFEAQAIEHIRKFYRIAQMEKVPVALAFSGGKDSIVCYDLCKKSGIPFTAVFNYSFEDPEVVKFIREKYPDVIIRKKEKSYFRLIRERNFLPTNKIRFCCSYFKESNNKEAIITGVRRQEGSGRKNRKMFEIKGKKNLRKYFDIFVENCTESGKSPIALRPILYWSEEEVWWHIKKYSLPYPALYDEGQNRCGCMLCPLASLKSNMYYIKKYPNLLPSFYSNVVRKIKFDLIFNNGSDSKKDLSGDPYRFLLYWLSASFRPSKKDKIMIDEYLKTVK